MASLFSTMMKKDHMILMRGDVSSFYFLLGFLYSLLISDLACHYVLIINMKNVLGGEVIKFI